MAISLINPFLNDVHTTFEAYISSTNYYNREQFSSEKWHSIRTMLENLIAFISYNIETASLKHRTQSSFEPINNKLYKKSDARHQTPRYVVQKAGVFDIIAQEHLKLLPCRPEQGMAYD